MNSEINEFQLIYAEKAKLCRSQAASVLVSCLRRWPELCWRPDNPQNADVKKSGDAKPVSNLNTPPPEIGLNPGAQGSSLFPSAVYCDHLGGKGDLNGVY